MCPTNNDKRKKTNNGGNRTNKSRKNRTLREKDTHSNLGNLKADRIKQEEMTEKKNKEKVS